MPSRKRFLKTLSGLGFIPFFNKSVVDKPTDSVTKPTTIQERATRAWYAHQGWRGTGIDEPPCRTTIERIATAFEEWYGEPADRVEPIERLPEWAAIYHDSLHLEGFIVDDPYSSWGHYLALTLIVTCPKCGGERRTGTFTGLWKLGWLLECPPEGFCACTKWKWSEMGG